MSFPRVKADGVSEGDFAVGSSLCLIFISFLIVLNGQWAFASPSAAQEPIPVVASVPFLTDIWGEVTCESKDFKLNTLVPAALDPHDYQLRPEDRAALERARLLLYVGRGFESWLDKLKRPKVQIAFEAARDLKLARMEGIGQQGSNDFDIHVWQSPDLVRDVGLRLAQVAKQLIPARAKYYELCRQSFDRKTEAKVLQIKALMKISHLEKRPFVVVHEGFRYFSDYFQLKMLSLSRYRNSAVRTPADFKKALENIRRQGAAVIFGDVLDSGREEDRLAKELHLKLGGKLFVDGPGPRGSGAETVFEMWQKNAETLIAGLK